MKLEYALIALSAVGSISGNGLLVFIALGLALAVKVADSLLERRKQAEATTLAAQIQERDREAARGLSEGVLERVSALETKVSNLTLKGVYDKSPR